MNKNKWLVPVLCIGIVLCLAVTMWALFLFMFGSSFLTLQIQRPRRNDNKLSTSS